MKLGRASVIKYA